MRFGYSKSIRGRVVECTPQLLCQALDNPATEQVCGEIEDALEKVKGDGLSRDEFETLKAELKKQLPIITPHAMFKSGRRLNSDAEASGLSMYDIDHISDPRGFYEQRIAGREKELAIVMAHVTPSTEGLRLLFIVPQGMTLAEAQQWMSKQLDDDDYDGCVKDLARCSFLVPRSYVVYLDVERLFGKTLASSSNDPHPSSNLRSEGVQECRSVDNSILRSSGVHPTPPPLEGSGEVHPSSLISHPSSDFKGIPYKDIIAEWFRRTGGEPQKGERNDRLHRLAAHLRYITDNNEQQLLGIMPSYGLSDEEMRGLIHSACQGRFYSMPKLLAEIIKSLSAKENEMAAEQEKDVPPAMPKRLPPLIKLLTQNTPEIYKAAVAHAVFPSLGAHLYKTRFRYIDNVEHEATLMNCLMAGTGAGKDCISEPINRIMADIRRRDDENLAREKAWKQSVNSKGANKDKAQRPEGLVIQEIDPDVTNAAFVQRMADADGHFLYVKLNEIDQFDALKGNGRGNHQFQIMCLAFDTNDRYGQTRIGTQSVTEKVSIRFNWNASTTVSKGQRYFHSVLTDGPISRINFCTIPKREIGADMPVYGTYDSRFDEQLRPYIERLVAARGTIECPQAFRLAQRLKNECAEFARLSQSETYWNLSFRANVIAYLKACVLYVAHGY